MTAAKTKKLKVEYEAAREALLQQGLSFRGWAKKCGFPVTTVYDAVHGRRRGPRTYRVQMALAAEIRR